MDARIPLPVQPVLNAYLQALEPLSAHIYGAYIYGSIALDAFEELSSDIDIIVLTQLVWLPDELKQLEKLHARLIKEYPLGRRLEVLYVPLADLGKGNREIAPYPTVHDQRFTPNRHGDLNGVTWWTLKHRSIRFAGPEPFELEFTYEWRQVLLAMRYNLDVYFASKARRPYIYLSDVAVEFAVTNLCRILTTAEEEEIISKSAALTRWRECLPERWQSLLDEAWRIRHHPRQPSLYRDRLRRMRETVAFIAYVRTRGDKALREKHAI